VGARARERETDLDVSTTAWIAAARSSGGLWLVRIAERERFAPVKVVVVRGRGSGRVRPTTSEEEERSVQESGPPPPPLFSSSPFRPPLAHSRTARRLIVLISFTYTNHTSKRETTGNTDRERRPRPLALPSTANSAPRTRARAPSLSFPNTTAMATPPPRWHPPPGGLPDPPHAGRLCLYNSLVDDKVPFVPQRGAATKRVSWYACGPTVYDSAHMGHARNYVTFDVLRRVLEDYFGYSVLYVMNVTDVDDKIILRARRGHLVEAWRRELLSAGGADASSAASSALAYAREAVAAAAAKQAKKADDLQAMAQAATDGRAKNDLDSAAKNERHKLTRVEQAAQQLGALASSSPIITVDAVLSVAGDQVAERLDAERGAEVRDQSIYRAHAAKYEKEFFEDMDALGVRRPDVTTRVCEYIPEVVAYVQRIVDQGMAYASPGGSVYFDVAAFRAKGHAYGKCKPAAVGVAALASEGEADFATAEKRGAADFALWKASKPGEPSWPSPWGPGRPGWHIECSAMASAVVGGRLDIHSGGEDLKFPHHDNELAQAEAHYHQDGNGGAAAAAAAGAGSGASSAPSAHECCHQWVNYFLHSGHLEIEGLKMSKSLKNFVTVREALTPSSCGGSGFTARQLRLMFLLSPWNRGMSYGESSRQEMRAREAGLKNFFQNVEVALREAEAAERAAGGGGGAEGERPTRWGQAEAALAQAIGEAQDRVYERLCDNVDTPGAMDALAALIKATNLYLAGKEEQQAQQRRRKQQEHGGAANGGGGGEDAAAVAIDDGAIPAQPQLLRKASSYVARILSVFGLIAAPADSAVMSESNMPGAAAAAALVAQLEAQAAGAGAAGAAGGNAAAASAGGAAATAADADAAVAPFLDLFASFRDEVRSLSRANNANKADPSCSPSSSTLATDLLAACDRVRDGALVELGVRLEDRPDGRPSVWKRDDPAALRQEAAERLASQRAALVKKAANLHALKARELDKLSKLAALPSVEQALAEKYSRFEGEGGAPLADKDGAALEGKGLDKARKDWEKAVKLREPLAKKRAEEGEAFLERLRAEVDELAARVSALGGGGGGEEQP
jgi:cysteinyl-tRNA synthetase